MRFPVGSRVAKEYRESLRGTEAVHFKAWGVFFKSSMKGLRSHAALCAWHVAVWVEMC